MHVSDSNFSGSQDDSINIHGSYLGVQGVNGQILSLEFPHQETWGFLPFEQGDEVAIVNAETLERLFSAHVRQAILRDYRHVEMET